MRGSSVVADDFVLIVVLCLCTALPLEVLSCVELQLASVAVMGGCLDDFTVILCLGRRVVVILLVTEGAVEVAASVVLVFRVL